MPFNLGQFLGSALRQAPGAIHQGMEAVGDWGLDQAVGLPMGLFGIAPPIPGQYGPTALPPKPNQPVAQPAMPTGQGPAGSFVPVTQSEVLKDVAAGQAAGATKGKGKQQAPTPANAQYAAPIGPLTAWDSFIQQYMAGGPQTTPVNTSAANGQPPGVGFGFGDVWNMLAHPVQGNLGGAATGLLGGLGNFLTDPKNQFMLGSLLAAGAPQGTNPQRMGQMFATQGAQELQGPMASQAYYGQGVPQQQGQQGPPLPQMQQSGLAQMGQQGQQQGGGYGNFLGGTPNFSNNVPAIDPAVARTMSLGDWATLSGIRTQTAETARLGRETSLKEQAAPYENIDRLYQAYANSPESAEHRHKLQAELTRLQGNTAPYTYDTKEVGDQLVTYRMDKRGGPVEVIRRDYNTPSMKDELELFKLGSQVQDLPLNKGMVGANAMARAMQADYTTDPSLKLKMIAEAFTYSAVGAGLELEEAIARNPFIPRKEKDAALAEAGGTSLYDDITQKMEGSKKKE